MFLIHIYIYRQVSRQNGIKLSVTKECIDDAASISYYPYPTAATPPPSPSKAAVPQIPEIPDSSMFVKRSGIKSSRQNIPVFSDDEQDDDMIDEYCFVQNIKHIFIQRKTKTKTGQSNPTKINVCLTEDGIIPFI